MSGQSEIRAHWKIIFACGVGVGAGTAGIPFYTIGMFVAPLEADFGWSRAAIQGMFSVFIFTGLLVFPLVGWLTDRYGVKRVAVSGLVGATIGYLCLGFLTQSITSYYIAAAVLGLLGAGTTPISWTKAITGWFYHQRGLALGLVLAGTGVGGMLAPKYVAYFIDSFGWRQAYFALALIPLVAIPLTVTFLKNPPVKREQQPGSVPAAMGKNLKEALRDYRFWVMAVAFFTISLAIAGSIPNLMPLLMDASIDRSVAASLLGVLGVTIIFGRVLSGFLLDKLWAPGVAAVMLILPTASAFILGMDDLSIPLAATAIILIGFAAGAEFDLLAYLTGRYFGFAHYSVIYSLLYVMLALGAAIAPPLFGYFYDRDGNYATIMDLAVGFFLFGSLTLLLLGRYPTTAHTNRIRK